MSCKITAKISECMCSDSSKYCNINRIINDIKSDSILI